MSRKEASHILPLDILRLLFEFSASNSLETARTLSLVSKDVQRWTDPHLFQIVHGIGIDYTISERSRTSLLNQMCMSDASPRLVLARSYARAATWMEHIPDKTCVHRALDSFPNLTQLCLWANIFPFGAEFLDSRRLSEITQCYPSLRRLATCLSDRGFLPPRAFESPFWMTITHLQVNYYHPASSSQSPFQLPLFTAMSSLTPLALLGMTSEREHDIYLAFSRVRETFPRSLCLCLLSLVGLPDVDRGQWFEEMASISRNVDERIVLLAFVQEGTSDEIVFANGSDNFHEWCGVHDGVQTCWEMGEAVLKRRRGQTTVV
ncbi:hypothetical protein DL96DRAFT_1814184 [Flagelloscypha sp. PMI_526]|nr:hypothetical protein DL96DRAFT_1814184 [Flagelloscypha sp. PMI_526]